MRGALAHRDDEQTLKDTKQNLRGRWLAAIFPARLPIGALVPESA